MDSHGRSQTQRSACRRCHYRKIKCNTLAGSTCSSCESAKVECVPHKKKRRNIGFSKEDSSAPLPPLRARLPAELVLQTPPQVAQDVEQNLPDMWNESPLDNETPVPEPRDDDNDHSGDGQTSNIDTGTDEIDEVDRAAAALSSLHDAGVQRHLVEMLSQDDIDQRVMQKGVRIVYVGQEFSNINYLIRHRAQNEAVHHFPANRIPRQFTSHHLDRIPMEAFYLPAAALVDELLHNYFTLVNPGFPILDQETFMRQYRSRNPQEPPSLLVLQAVLLVGAHVSLQRPDRDELKEGFFRRAKMLFDARFECNRDVVVQAALLLTWHSEGVEDVGANSYHWVSVAVRTAFGLGMHRDCGQSTLVPQDRRVWRRLWWILVQFDVLVTLSYGRPQAINLDDADVPPLTAEDFDGLDGNADTDFVIHHAGLCAIISQVLRERFGLHVPAARKTAALQQADRLLAHWITNLPPALRAGAPDSAKSTWQAVLHIDYNAFLILLHRPPPKSAAARAVQTEDIEICSSAASMSITLFESLRVKNELRCVNVFAVNALFTTLIQLSAEMRVRNPLLSANAMGKFDAAIEVLRALSNFWFNAEIIQRLFEDGSERLQQELRIGKSTNQVTQHSRYMPFADSAVTLPEGVEYVPWVPIDNTNNVSQGLGQSQDNGISSDQQPDWTHLYWENSGFNYISPFGDMGLYQPT